MAHIIDRGDREEKGVARESLTLCHSVSRDSVSEWSHSLSVACDLVHNDQRVVHTLSRQSEGRAPVESQLMSCVSYHLQLSRSQGTTWAGEYPNCQETIM